MLYWSRDKDGVKRQTSSKKVADVNNASLTATLLEPGSS